MDGTPATLARAASAARGQHRAAYLCRAAWPQGPGNTRERGPTTTGHENRSCSINAAESGSPSGPTEEGRQLTADRPELPDLLMRTSDAGAASWRLRDAAVPAQAQTCVPPRAPKPGRETHRNAACLLMARVAREPPWC